MRDLPKFGTVAKCAACGHEQQRSPMSGQVVDLMDHSFSTEFCKQRMWDTIDTSRDDSYIRRVCPNCGYTWRELPLYLVDK